MRLTIKVLISGIPRGYQFPRSDGNWLLDPHKEQITSISSEIELIEVPPHRIQESAEKLKHID